MRTTATFRRLRYRVRGKHEELAARIAVAEPRPYPGAADVVARNMCQLMEQSKSLRDTKALAENCGVPEVIVNGLLQQQCALTANTLDRIAAAFGIPTWTLLHPDWDRKRREAEMLDSFLFEMRK